MLQSLRLSNIRRFGTDVKLDIGDGATILLAPNGIGKTSIFEAIEFALTGGVTRLRDDLTPLVKHGETEASVILDFGDTQRVAKLVRPGTVTVSGDLAQILGQVDAKDLPFLLRLTHLLDQRDHHWFIFADQKKTADQLARLPIGRDATQANDVLPSTQKAAARRSTEAKRLKEEALARREVWERLLAERGRNEHKLEESLVALSDIREELATVSYSITTQSYPADAGRTLEQLVKDVAELSVQQQTRQRNLLAYEGAITPLDGIVTEYAEIVKARERLRTEMSVVKDAQEQARTALLGAESELMRAISLMNDREAVNARLYERQSQLRVFDAAKADLATKEAARLASTTDAENAERTLLAIEASRALLSERLDLHEGFRVRIAALASAKAEASVAEAQLQRWREAEQELRGAVVELERIEAEVQVADAAQRQASEFRVRSNQNADDARRALSHATAASDSIRGAIGLLATVLPQDRGDCPLCGEVHGAAELRRRISRALESVDPTLGALTERVRITEADSRLAESGVEQARTNYVSLESRRTYLVSRRNSLQEAIAVIRSQAKFLGSSPEEEWERIGRRIVEFESSENRLEAERAVAPTAPSVDEVAAKDAELSRARVLLQTARARLAEAAGDRDRAAARLNALEANGVDVDVTFEEQLATAERALADARSAMELAQGRAQRCRTHQGVADAAVQRGESLLDAAEQRARSLLAAWAAVPLAGEPAEDTLGRARERARAEHQQAEGERARIDVLQRQLAGWKASQAHTEIQQAIDAARGSRSETEHTEYLNVCVDNTEKEYQRRLRAHAALELLSQELSAQLEDVHGRVAAIVPRWQSLLQRVVRDDRFSRIGLEFYSRYRKEHADVRVPLHDGHVAAEHVASEAQSTDLQLTFLLAMALGRPWCAWRALLLDDPTQHHDLVHASAVFDVIRSYITDHGFQVMLATHDTLQARYFYRKLMNDGVTAKVYSLEPTEAGVDVSLVRRPGGLT